MTGTKDDKQKPMPRLVLGTMARALLEVSKVATFGAEKYSPDNWLKVENGLERYTDAKDRHRLEGAISEYDSESGLLHAAHEAWNALAVLELKLRAAEERIENIGQNGNDGEVYESQCWCEECSIRTVTLPGTGKPLEIRAMMALCPQCGDKRCERAKHHDNECAYSQPRDLEKPWEWRFGDLAEGVHNGRKFKGRISTTDEDADGKLIFQLVGGMDWIYPSSFKSVVGKRKPVYRDLEKPWEWQVGDYTEVLVLGKKYTGLITEITRNSYGWFQIVIDSFDAIIPPHQFNSVEARS